MKNICFMCMFDSCSYAIVLVSIKMETRFIISMLLQYSEKAASLMLEVIKTKKNDSFYFQYSLSLSLSLYTPFPLYLLLCALSFNFILNLYVLSDPSVHLQFTHLICFIFARTIRTKILQIQIQIHH